MTRLRAWLELTRGANLPTVWSNILVGWLLAVSVGAGLSAGSFPALGAALLGGSLLYVAGMFLNDAADEAWDRAHRPGRPIPSGRLPRGQVLLAGRALLLLGALALIPAGPAALVGLPLAGLILAYTRWHKSRPALAPWLMGACRAPLPLVGFAAAGSLPDARGPWLLTAHAVALFLATAGISLLARHEATGGRPGRAASAVAWLALLPAPAMLLAAGALGWSVVIWTAGLALGLSWTARRVADVGERVAVRIAGLALVDYQLWLAIRPAFDRADPLAMGGLMLLLFFGTALALRRLLPST